jgi:hypothetical protein
MVESRISTTLRRECPEGPHLLEQVRHVLTNACDEVEVRLRRTNDVHLPSAVRMMRPPEGPRRSREILRGRSIAPSPRRWLRSRSASPIGVTRDQAPNLVAGGAVGFGTRAAQGGERAQESEEQAEPSNQMGHVGWFGRRSGSLRVFSSGQSGPAKRPLWRPFRLDSGSAWERPTARTS